MNTGAVKGLGMVNGKARVTRPHEESDEEKFLYKHYEAAAREYMKLIGANPDADVRCPHPKIAGAFVTIAAWKLQVHELRTFDLKFLALLTTQNSRMPTHAEVEAVAAADQAAGGQASDADAMDAAAGASLPGKILVG